MTNDLISLFFQLVCALQSLLLNFISLLDLSNQLDAFREICLEKSWLKASY